MKDIVKEIKCAESKGGVKENWSYYRRETLISREYFNNVVTARYPNLVFVRIFMQKTIFIPTFHESMRDEEYHLYSVFIDKNMLEYLASDSLIGNLNGEKVINLSKLGWKDQIDLRNKILKACPIIMAEYNIYFDDRERFVGNINMGLSSDISIYPHSYKIDSYELLNATRFILISNSSVIEQRELDDLCMKILKKLCQENQKVIGDKKAIYLSISRKLKCNEELNEDEVALVEQFITSEINKIEKDNSLLVRSRVMSTSNRGKK